MKIIRTVQEMQAFADAVRASGRRIALVPTMGYLHDGHLSLVREAANRCGEVVVSIFVNPTQFGPNEDLDAYPRNFDRDRDLSESAGATAIFAPEPEEIYPPGFQTYVTLETLPAHLCGLSRPIHFRGVATVVTKLFNIVKPHVAVFGEKDYQQLLVVRRMVRDLNFDVEIVGGPIVREEDGLAMSSRNAYLTSGQRKQALCLSRSLDAAEAAVKSGETDPARLIHAARERIAAEPEAEIDYVRVVDPETLEDAAAVRGPVVMALAVKIGTPRLIDNRTLIP
jgi:pantoate--beta-alanine ligase